MNWTEGSLYRHSRSRLRKVNPLRQQQKAYFARARVHAVEIKAARENGPPPISYLEPNSPSARSSHALNRSGSSPEDHSTQTATLWSVMTNKLQHRTATDQDDSPLPTISRFFREQSERENAADLPHQYDKATIERLRKNLLAKKD